MSSKSEVIDLRSLPDRRFMKERRTTRNRRILMERNISEQTSQSCIFSPFLHVLCLILVAVAGLVTYQVSGLFGGIDSTVGHIVVGGGIVYYFIIMFRHGVSRGRY